jgi:SnoaL-like domain
VLSRSRVRAVVVAAAVCAVAGIGAAASASGARDASSFTVTRQVASTWMKGYIKAWETRDADAAAALFTPNGVYQDTPGDPAATFRGRAAIRRYWADITRPQSQIHGLQGTPTVQGNKATIEIWVRFKDPDFNPKGNPAITLLETNVLTFASSGLVSKNVEYYHILTGFHSPPPGWGT